MNIMKTCVFLLLSVAALTGATDYSSGQNCTLQEVGDVYFIIDASGSLTKVGYGRQLDFVNACIQAFPIGPNNVRIGLGNFSNDFKPIFDFDTSYDKDELSRRLYSSIKSIWVSRLDIAYDKVLADGHLTGHRVPVIVVSVSDYGLDEPTAALNAIQRIRNETNAITLSMTIGVVNQTTAEALAGSPNNVKSIRDTGAVDFVRSFLGKVHVCTDNEPPTTTTTAPPTATPAPCRNKLAIAVCMDSSGSMTKEEFNTIRSSVKHLIDSLDFTSGQVQFASGTFSTHNYPGQTSLTRDPAEASQGVDNTWYHGGTTNTHLCVNWARDLLDREADTDAKGVIIIYTDGESSVPHLLLQAVAEANDRGYISHPIGIGSEVNTTELALTGTGGNYLLVENFTDLSTILNEILFRVCNATPPPPCPNDCPREIAFCVDSSGSIPKDLFFKNMEFLRAVVSYFKIGPTSVQVGFASFGGHTYNTTNGITGDPAAVQQGIQALPYRGSLTNYETCINWAVAAIQASNRHAPGQVVLITDGEPTNRAAADASVANAKALGIDFAVVAVGSEPNIAYLTTIATLGPVLHCENYKTLTKLAYQLAKTTCDAAEA